MLELDVKIEARDLYDYMVAHTYSKPINILASCFGAFMILVGSMNKHWIFVIGGVVLLLYLPWTLFLKSRQQALNNPAFKNSLHYVLDENGITISAGEESQSQTWDNMYKAISTSKSIIVYTSPVNATIFPRRVMGADTTKCIQIISTHMPPAKVKIRY
jgi:hypothetical protein